MTISDLGLVAMVTSVVEEFTYIIWCFIAINSVDKLKQNGFHRPSFIDSYKTSPQGEGQRLLQIPELLNRKDV